MNFKLIYLIVVLACVAVVVYCDDEPEPTDLVFVSDVVEEDDTHPNKNGQHFKLTRDLKFADVNTNPDDLFIPTNEWQEVRENQAVPRGLHIRLNLETGKKEAKLLDEDKDGEQMRALNRNLFDNSPDKPAMFNYDEIKKALKGIKDDGVAVQVPIKSSEEQQHDADVQSQYRNIDEIKKDFDALNLNIKTNNEILTELFVKLKNESLKIDEKLNILNEIEYHVHFYDNGILLKDIGAFSYLINQINNTIIQDASDAKLVTKMVLTLGVAIQGNPKVQIYAIEQNFLQLLLQLLERNANLNELNTKLIYTLAALIRHFPYAQVKFLEYGGLQRLNELISNTEKNSNKLKVKVLILINDLLLEKVHVLNDTHNEVNPEKVEQYKRVDLKERLVDIDWCNNLINLLDECTEHDTREKVLESIKTLLNVCSHKFDLTKLVGQLKRLTNEYDSLALNDVDDDGSYFKNISNLARFIKDYLNNFKRKTEEL